MWISNDIGNVSARNTHTQIYNEFCSTRNVEIFMAQSLKSSIELICHRFLSVITILIGPNDFCLDFCYQNEPERSSEHHRRDLIETLRILRDNLPRTIVNVVTPPSKQHEMIINHI